MEKINKNERQNKILLKLKNNPKITQIDLAKDFNVNKSTISRDIIDLSLKGALQEINGVLGVVEGYFIEDIKFSLFEAFNLYSSASLMVDRSDFVNHDLIYALRKLSASLEKTQPHMCNLLKNIAQINEMEIMDDLFNQNLEKIIMAWTKKNHVQIEYLSRREQTLKTFIIEILDFTPYADGHGSHLIGYDIENEIIKPFRFKRIKSIKILNSLYKQTIQGKIIDYFKDAWKIWISDYPSVEVVLRFNSNITSRVLETKWHRNQVTEIQPDKSLLWKCCISEPREMEYWILGWGSNVEVINPPELKEYIKEEIKKLNIIYKVAENASVKE